MKVHAATASHDGVYAQPVSTYVADVVQRTAPDPQDETTETRGERYFTTPWLDPYQYCEQISGT
jgi:hypothetical protein